MMKNQSHNIQDVSEVCDCQFQNKEKKEFETLLEIQKTATKEIEEQQ
jgi:hypothetical protein